MTIRELLKYIESFHEVLNLENDVVVELDGSLIFHDIENIVKDNDEFDRRPVLVLRVTTY